MNWSGESNEMAPHSKKFHSNGNGTVAMLCVDCLVEDQVEELAITVTNGFALCNYHLLTYVERIAKNSRKNIETVEKFVADESKRLGLKKKDEV